MHRLDGFLFLVNSVDLFAVGVPLFFCGNQTLCFRTWLILSDAIVHTGESSRNLFKSSYRLIVFTIFRLVLNQPDVRLVPNWIPNWSGFICFSVYVYRKSYV